MSLQSLYNRNPDKYNNIFKKTESSIRGRVCHPSIISLIILCENDPSISSYLEIGVHNGGSMSLIVSNGNHDKKCFGIDLFQDMYDEKKHLNKSKFTRYQYFKRDNLNIAKSLKNIQDSNTTNAIVNLIQGNSYFDDTEQKFKDQLTDSGLKGIDLLFIDGDHTVDGVRNDYERYSKYVKTGGWIVFDDYHHPEVKRVIDSYKFKNFQLFKANNTTAVQYIVHL